VKVLITGAAGLIARHLARKLSRDYEVLALKREALDISDQDAVHRCVADTRPGLIINCAVIQVDEAQENPARAHSVNFAGPRYIAEAAAWTDAEVIHFGSQYAFDGEPAGRAPYTIQDKPRPVNVYGETKIAGEEAVRDHCVRSYIVRTSWVYGNGKKSFLCTVPEDLRSGTRVRAIGDIWSSTTYVDDLIDRLLLVLDRKRYDTYHIVNEGVCSYYEFALEAGRLLGIRRRQLDGLIEVMHEREMMRSAIRPRYTPMSCLVSDELGLPPMRDWKAALAAYVKSSLR